MKPCEVKICTARQPRLEPCHQRLKSMPSSFSLKWNAFPNHADTIIPELRKAAERKDNVGGYARAAVKRLEASAVAR